MRSSRVTVAVMLGALVGLALGVIVKGQLEEAAPPSVTESAVPPSTTEAKVPARERPAAQAALAYAHALMENDWPSVVRQTWWMRARLDRVRTEGGDVEEARRALAESLSDRNKAGNRLRPDGIEDQYLFRPGARAEVLAADDGAEDLEPAAAGRAWVRVTYGGPERAPLGPTGLPVRSLVVGVNVDEEGLVLKAGLSGNLEIDEGSISLDWE